jgi:hypothetical protein
MKTVAAPTWEWLACSNSLQDDLSIWHAWSPEYNVSAVSLDLLGEEGQGRRVLFELLIEALHHPHAIHLLMNI